MLCRIYDGTGPHDARLVRDWFERNAIRAFVRWEGLLHGLLGAEAHGGWPSVWVFAFDRDAAASLIVHPQAPRDDGCPLCLDDADGDGCWLCSQLAGGYAAP